MLHSIHRLAHLEWLSIRCRDDVYVLSPDSSWPPHLKTLLIAGIHNIEVLDYFLSLPKTLSSLTLYDCRTFVLEPTKILLKSLGAGLERFSVRPGLSTWEPQDLGEWLQILPAVKFIHICEPDFAIPWDMSHLSPPRFDADNPHPLEHLELDFGGDGQPTDRHLELDLDPLWNAVAEGFLRRVRLIRYYFRRDTQLTRRFVRVVEDLDDLLRALAREDGENATFKEEDAGAYIVRR